MYPWLQTALDERGVREIPGRLDNARIEEYLRTTNYPIPAHFIDEIPWCSGFENWIFLENGIEGTYSAWSQSWLDWGVECEPRQGAVIIFKWGGKSGHVGTIYAMDPNGAFVIGGNQSNSVCISFFGLSHMVGTRWPEGQPF